jgi:hypothetical protein
MAKRVTVVSEAYEAEFVAALDAAVLGAMKRTNTDAWWQRLEQYLCDVLISAANFGPARPNSNQSR